MLPVSCDWVCGLAFHRRGRTSPPVEPDDNRWCMLLPSAVRVLNPLLIRGTAGYTRGAMLHQPPIGNENSV